MQPADLAFRALESAGIGGWDLDLATGRLLWTSVTFSIHELEPDNQPDIDAAIGFYRPDAQPIIRAAVAQAIDHGVAWDIELPFITAKGRPIWVRACGCAVEEDGRKVRLTGTFQDVTVRREQTAQADRLSLVVRQMTNAVLITGPDGRTEWVNEAFERLSGYTLADMKGHPPGRILQGPETDPTTVDHIRSCIRAGCGFEVEILNYTSAGLSYWMAITCTPLLDDHGRLNGFIAVETDITDRRKAEDAACWESQVRERAEALLRDVLDSLPSAVTAFDADERLILVNQAYREMFPISGAYATPGCTLEELVRFGIARGQYPEAGTDAEAQDAWATHYLAAQREVSGPHSLRLPGDRHVLARERRSASGNLVCVRSDTSELMRAEAKLRAQAQRDPLTGLANRAAFVGAMLRSLEPGNALPPVAGALMLFDVDHFKSINDTFGHDAGDAVLVEIATRLRSAIRGGDLAVRLGGDEFVVIMNGLTDKSTAAVRIETIQSQLSLPMSICGQNLGITTSAGVTLFPQDGPDPASLLKTADLALYESKRGGRGRWCFFQSSLAETAHEHDLACDGLRSALAHGNIQVLLQPRRRLAGGHAGFHAQPRWNNGRAWVTGNDFIPTSADSVLVADLGQASLAATMACLRALRRSGLEPGRTTLKVSTTHLMQPDFLSDTLGMLHEHDLAAIDLEIEVPASILHDGPSAKVETVLGDVSASGIAVALDGLGHSAVSLADLFRLPIDRLTIGRDLVAGIGRPDQDGGLIRAVFSVATSMALPTTAEDVQTVEQRLFLAAAGCDAAWGSAIAGPLLTLEQMSAYLAGELASIQGPERVRALT